MAPRSGPQQLDLDGILRRRAGGIMKYVPRAATRLLERAICQKQLNEILRATYPARGSDFSRRVLEFLDIHVEVEGMENIPAEGRFVFASNHPLGGLDGIALIALLGEKYGDDGIRFLVNDMLMNVEPLRDVFLPINKYGSQGRRAAKDIAAAYAGPGQILVFPAGLVSRRQPGGIRDLDWQKAFVVKAIESDRAVIPVRVDALNSNRFYRLAQWRKRLGVKVNIEQAFLPSEIMKSRGKRIRILFGKPLSAERLRATGKQPRELACALKELVYKL